MDERKEAMIVAGRFLAEEEELAEEDFWLRRISG